MAQSLTATFFRSDEDPQTCWMVAVFESREAYRANAERPNQDVRYRLMRSCLEEDPEWHDGEVWRQLAAEGVA